MASTAAPNLLPHAAGGNRIGVVLALLAHAGLVVALALGTQWRTQSPSEVSAELWAAVPQSAAPTPTPPPQPQVMQAAPTPAPKPEPVLPAPKQPAAQPEQPNRDAEIAVEKAKALVERKALDAAAQKKAQAEAEAQKKRDDDKSKAAAAKQEDERLAKQREDNLRRMLGQAGGTGTTVSTNPNTNSSSNPGSGSSTVSAAPSASYAGRVVAHVRPLIVLTAQVNGNPSAEVEVRTAAGGTILSRRVLKTSGQSDWDEAVLRAIDRAGSLPRDADGRVPPVLTLVFRPLD